MREKYVLTAAAMAATCTWKPCEEAGEEKAVIGKLKNLLNHVNCLIGHRLCLWVKYMIK